MIGDCDWLRGCNLEEDIGSFLGGPCIPYYETSNHVVPKGGNVLWMIYYEYAIPNR